jgi:transcriptional regulator of arginine metabolism
MTPRRASVIGGTNIQIMNKTFRQGQILKVIRGKRILTQEDLARELKENFGLEATQVTLSRDIRELGLLKTPDGYRQVTASAAGPDVATIAGELLQDVRTAQNLIVLRTSPGNANALAVALDKENWPEITGTIAGDDTVLIVAPDNATAVKLSAKLRGYAESQ